MENLDLMHPLSVCAMWDPLPAYPWQAKVINKLFVRGSRLVLSTPNEAGKTSWVVANAGLACMTMYPGCQVVSTAGVFRQVSQQLWPEVRAKVNKYPDWAINDEKCTAPRVRGLPASVWNIFATNDPLNAEGYHGRTREDKDGNQVYCPLLYIIDEAKGVENGIFEAMFRCDPDFVLVVSTPGEESGEFYNIIDLWERNVEQGIVQADVGVDWEYVKVKWGDCPHLMEGSKRQTREQLIRQYGIKNPFIQSMVYGNFVRTGGFFIFDSRRCKLCATHNIPLLKSDRHAAVDLAGGGDEVVFGYRIGNKEMDMQIRDDRDTAETSLWLENLFLKYKLRPDQITMDEGGLGRPIIDFLERRNWIGINRYNFDDKADDVAMFMTRGMEDHMHLSTLINEQAIKIIDDDIAHKQMRLRKFNMPNSNGGVMQLESKRKVRSRGEGSPDRLDMRVMLWQNFHMDFSPANILKPGSLFPDRFLSFIKDDTEGGTFGMRLDD